MIFATVGTNEAAFDRLVVAVGELDLDEELVVQRGSSRVELSNATVHDYLSFDEMARFARAARAIVSHAGVGSVLVALAAGHKPIVIPRLVEHGEAVDDHQLTFARRFAAEGLVTLADLSTLGAAVSTGPSRSARSLPHASALTDELRTVIAETLTSGGRGSRHPKGQ
jgi:UDP-N-acetylglucosamine transferase subunit ALG13